MRNMRATRGGENDDARVGRRADARQQESSARGRRGDADAAPKAATCRNRRRGRP